MKIKSPSLIAAMLIILCSMVYSQPALLWNKRYNGTGNLTENGWHVSVDNLGNTIVAGSSANQDIIILKYGITGNELWNIVIPPLGQSFLTGLAVDNGNNIILSYSNTLSTLVDFVTAKYSPAGALLWNTRYNYLNNGNDYSGSIKLDTTGNVYICGSNQSPSGTCGLLTIKYNSSGIFQWSNYTSTASNLANVYDMELDNTGNIYYCGKVAGVNFNAFISKISPAGAPLFYQTYNYSSVSGTDLFYDLAIDNTNNMIYTAGSSWGGTSSTDDFITAKYNSTGVLQWIQRYDGPSHGLDNAGSVAVDNAGNVYSGGISHGGSTNYDIAIAKYSSAGTPMGYQRYSVGSTSESFTKMIIDRQQNIYITGEGSGDALVIKYNTALTMQWAKYYNSPFNANDGALNIAVDSLNVYVTGFSEGTLTGNDILTLKYGPLNSVIPVGSEIPEKFMLYQNYPNPFNPITNIMFDILNGSNVKLIITDALGKVKEVLNYGILNAGKYELKYDASGLSSGIYFFSLQAGSFKDVKKMVLVK